MSEILTERSGSILRIQLNRPEKKNAMTSETQSETVRVASARMPTRWGVRTKKEKMGHVLDLGQHDLTGHPKHSQARFEFASVGTAIRELRAGRMIVVIDDEARVPDLFRFCETHGLVMITVADLARYRLESEYEESLWAIDASLVCV